MSQQSNLASEALERLGQLAADGTCPDDCHPAGKFGQGKDGFVGKVVSLLQPGDGWLRGGCPSGDYSTVKI